MCKVAVAKKVLLHYIDELAGKRSPLLDYKATNDKALLADLIVNNPQTSAKHILQQFCLKKANHTPCANYARDALSAAGKKLASVMGDVRKTCAGD